MKIGFAKIICVEPDSAKLESRCAVLKHAGYDVWSTEPRVAEIALRSQKFDLVVVSALSDQDLHRIINFSDGADVLVVDEGPVVPSVFILLVQERLARLQLLASSSPANFIENDIGMDRFAQQRKVVALCTSVLKQIGRSGLAKKQKIGLEEQSW